MRATVVTDASFCHTTKSAGWAAWVAIDGGVKIKKSGTFKYPIRGSTDAELYAALNGIWLAAQAGAVEMLLQSDCEAVVSALNVYGHGGKSRLARVVENEMLKHVPQRILLYARHVKGHSSINDQRSWCNRWCDAEAKKQMRALRDGKAT